MEEEKGKTFADGIRFEAPSDVQKEKTPWIKGKISVKVEEFIGFLRKHETAGGWVNLDLKKSKGGKLYIELNTWKPTKPKEEDTLSLDTF